MISVIIPTYRKPDLIHECLRTLKRNLTDSTYVEVLVVNNDPDDKPSANMARSHGARVVDSDENAFGYAINLGLREARGDFMLWLNNDAFVPDGWDVRMMRAFTDGSAAVGQSVGFAGPRSNAVGGPQKIDGLKYPEEDWEKIAEAIRKRDQGKFAKSWFLSGFCLMHTRDAYDRIGDVDERFGLGGFEDSDYVRRGREAGLAAVMVGDVFVHHRLSQTFREFHPGYETGVENREIYKAKWGSFPEHWEIEWRQR